MALDEYATHMRELERRIQLVEAQNASGEERAMPEAPSGVPERWEDHMEMMFDLQVLALQADLTRAITFKTGYDLSNKVFPESGTNKSYHGASHHANVPAAIMEFNLIGAPQRFARIAAALGESVDGLTTMEAARRSVDAVRELNADLDIPPDFAQTPFSDENIETMADDQTQTLGSEHICPGCGRACQLECRSRPIQVRGGPAELKEPVAHCPTCRRDFFPSASRAEDRRARL